MRFGYTIIFVEDVVKTVEFYEKAFDLKRRSVNPLFAEMETEGVTLAFGANSNERSELPIEFRENHPSVAPAGVQISFIAADVEAAYTAAVKAGAIEVVKPQRMPWGQTISRVRDLNGVLVSLVSQSQS
ncbi:MAG: VOC family protein [Scytonema hyalinum WJT4-NPBG1]|nr:VOC family protein [Scytonema hyalinum WJT4-NPBG1]